MAARKLPNPSGTLSEMWMTLLLRRHAIAVPWSDAHGEREDQRQHPPMYRYVSFTDGPIADIVDFSRPSYGRCDSNTPTAHSPRVCSVVLLRRPTFTVPWSDVNGTPDDPMSPM